MNDGNNTKMWQVLLFSLNNLATNLYLVSMGFISYYATGIVGLGVVFIGFLLTAMRIWDAVTDPIIAVFIDKTNGRLGKFRPFMIIGNIGMAFSVILIFWVTHTLPQILRLPFFIAMYVAYIIFYTFQQSITKAAQSVLTKNPKQRPIFAFFDTIWSMLVLSVGFSMYVSNFLIRKYEGGFRNIGLYNELMTTIIILSALFTLCGIIGIWKRDRPEFFDVSSQRGQKIKIRDYWDVIKKNRALQMLVLAASSDKLGAQVGGNPTTNIILYGIIVANYGLSGQISMVVALPCIAVSFIGIRIASKFGQRLAVVVCSVVCILFSVFQALMIGFGDMTKLSITAVNFFTILWLVVFIFRMGSQQVCTNIVIPMIGDCTDYETYRSGNYIPGMMGNLFSLVDKFIASFSNSVVAILVAAIGYTSAMPQVGEAATTPLKILCIVFFCGFPIFGWLLNLVAMKFYPLNAEKMREIHQVLAERKLKETAATT
jgi:Na+/melibiose symporter-like transporter